MSYHLRPSRRKLAIWQNSGHTKQLTAKLRFSLVYFFAYIAKAATIKDVESFEKPWHITLAFPRLFYWDGISFLLYLYLRIAYNLWFSNPNLLNAGITAMHHCIQCTYLCTSHTHWSNNHIKKKFAMPSGDLVLLFWAHTRSIWTFPGDRCASVWPVVPGGLQFENKGNLFFFSYLCFRVLKLQRVTQCTFLQILLTP